jgi:putative salt-induced outer membrane protein YdiY
MRIANRSVRTPRLRWAAVFGTALLWSVAAEAQPAALEQHSEHAAADAFQADVTSMNASLGGSLNTGNTEAWQLNAGSAFALVRGRHGMGLVMEFAYGRADVPEDGIDEMVDTVRNLRTKGRYDFFLTPMDAIFLASAYRWDTFAGLDARVQGQLGYMRNVYKVKDHRFWAELGYDLTYDNYDPDPLPDPNDPTMFLDGDAVVHSARGFLGYENKLNAALTFVTGIEGLLNVEDTDDLRVNWDNALRSAISGNFSLEAKFSLLLDTQPVPGAKKVDTLTTLNLIYTLI